MFYPTISLTGFLGGVSGDLTTFLGGSGGIWSVGAGLLQPIYQGGRLRRNIEVAQARFDQALAMYQKAALNGYREVANALVTIQKLAEERVQHEAGVTVLRGCRRPRARPLRFRARQLHRDPDGRPGPVRAAVAARADAWGGIPGARRALSGARRRMAATTVTARTRHDGEAERQGLRERTASSCRASSACCRSGSKRKACGSSSSSKGVTRPGRAAPSRRSPSA